jgi:hypothetical protein
MRTSSSTIVFVCVCVCVSDCVTMCVRDHAYVCVCVFVCDRLRDRVCVRVCAQFLYNVSIDQNNKITTQNNGIHARPAHCTAPFCEDTNSLRSLSYKVLTMERVNSKQYKPGFMLSRLTRVGGCGGMSVLPKC